MFPTDRDIMQENTINIMVRFRNKPHGLQQTVQSQDELISNKLQETSRIRQGTVTYQIIQAVYLCICTSTGDPSRSSFLPLSFHSFILVLYLHNFNLNICPCKLPCKKLNLHFIVFILGQYVTFLFLTIFVILNYFSFPLDIF